MNSKVSARLNAVVERVDAVDGGLVISGSLVSISDRVFPLPAFPLLLPLLSLSSPSEFPRQQ